MSDQYEPDPEVIADLQLRAASERDSSRSRGAEYTWTKPVMVENWKCRSSSCENVVGVTDAAVEAKATWDRMLHRKMEASLVKSTIVFCDACKARGVAMAPDNNRGHVDALAEAIRKLKDSGDATRETELIKKLEKLHHPDITGLIKAITERRVAESGRVGKRKL